MVAGAVNTHFKIISAGWKSSQWIKDCVESILDQKYTNYDVCFVDDASDDSWLSDYIVEVCDQNSWHCILRETHAGAVKNQVDGIRLMKPDPEDVIVFLDSDDRLAHDHVLDHLDQYYGDGTRLTYGSYMPVPFSPTCNPAMAYPADVRRTGDYRACALRGGGILWNHLRTMKAELFLALNDEDFYDQNGRWLQSTTDSAFMFPCMELAGGRIRFIREVLLHYNSENPLSDWRRQPKQVDIDHHWVLTRPRKTPLYPL